ncbi:DAK2 domain-containing protein [Gorillibacterium sp. sgz5001074]|uniref:DAK2 domain-containing protein n=1 Tax=Gorillibacterium sp. sgz5001074 TaxID=3446695 RepID=UPI003F66B9B6
MSKRFNTLNGTDFYQMVLAGAAQLTANVNRVNALNVFPVPDGDTGTNMNLTMTSGVEELKKRPNAHIGKAAEALSKGLLMGARGNSGVILSQIFRGFAKSVHDLESVNAQQFAAALQNGVDTAYKAVVKPVEGTILTVSKEAAKHAVASVRRFPDIADLMGEVVSAGNLALSRTPELLPVLKQVGVVDAGGQGLMCIYEGFLAVLTGRTDAAPVMVPEAVAAPAATAQAAAPKSAQSHLKTEDIEYGYCTEFIVNLVPGKVKGLVFEEPKFRAELEKHGDSLLVVADEDLVKVHIHAEYPGNVMNIAMNYGDLSKIKIENMRDQHTHILTSDEYAYIAPASDIEALKPIPVHAGLHDDVSLTGEARQNGTAVPGAASAYGFVTVAMGDGIKEIFTSLGVGAVISGGQTMNPSTEDIVNAVMGLEAETVYILPNNSNIILAAKQAVDLVEGRRVVVIPTKSVPQGMAAMLSFDENADADANTEAMQAAVGSVQSGQVTFAVRDTTIDGIEIKEGDFIGIHDNTIVTANSDLLETCRNLLDSMLESGGEIVTILTGEEASESDTKSIEEYLKDAHPDAEVEVHYGGQPLYAYLFAVE